MGQYICINPQIFKLYSQENKTKLQSKQFCLNIEAIYSIVHFFPSKLTCQIHNNISFLLNVSYCISTWKICSEKAKFMAQYSQYVSYKCHLPDFIGYCRSTGVHIVYHQINIKSNHPSSFSTTKSMELALTRFRALLQVCIHSISGTSGRGRTTGCVETSGY